MTDYLDPHFVRALCRDPERRTLQVSKVKQLRVYRQSVHTMRVYAIIEEIHILIREIFVSRYSR